MKCTNCGSEIAPGQAFCSTCGTPVPKQQPAQGGAVNQNLGGQVEFNPPPKKRVGASILVIIITLLIIAGIIVGAVLLINNIREDDDSSSSSSSRKKNNNDDDDDNLIDNSLGNKVTNNVVNNVTNNVINNTVTPSGNTSGYTVNVGSFVVKVPTNYIYKVSGDTVAMTNEDDTLLIRMQIKESPYSSIVAQKDELGNRMRSSGATINKMEEKTINGTQCLVYEITESGESYIIALVRINSMYTALCEVIRDDYTTYDYDGLKDAISVALTAEKSTSTTTTTTDSSNSTANTSNMETKSKLDLNTVVE